MVEIQVKSGKQFYCLKNNIIKIHIITSDFCLLEFRQTIHGQSGGWRGRIWRGTCWPVATVELDNESSKIQFKSNSFTHEFLLSFFNLSLSICYFLA